MLSSILPPPFLSQNRFLRGEKQVYNKKDQWIYQAMLVPGMVLLFIFSIIPMFGVVIAFQNYFPSKGILGSSWVGLKNFRYMLNLPNFTQIFSNTVIIAVAKIIMGIIVPVLYSLLLNEVRRVGFKRTVQTAIYLPHFLSWVILSNIVINIVALDGVVNGFIRLFGGKEIYFMASPEWFRWILVISDIWKEAGFGTVVYLAAITAIDPTLYEAAAIDGAGKIKRIVHVTLPGMAPTIVLMATLALGRVMDAGFDQIFNMYNPLVYETGDIIDTYVYRTGLVGTKYGLATAVGVVKSVISFVLIVLSYRLADRYAGYRIF